MAKGIQDLGQGGYLYATQQDGTTIMITRQNTTDGVKNMRQFGTANAPIAALRPAVATITFTTVIASNITAISVGGINQIGANVVLTTTNTTTAATLSAAAINAYTPAGNNYTAQAVGNVLYLYSPFDQGTAVNGVTPVVSTSSGSNVITPTVFSGGSDGSGVSDYNFGYRFFMDANYGSAGYPGGGTATPTDLTYAIEITKYMTVRGMQAGVITTALSIATDRLTGINRACAITQLIVDTESSAATDVVAFIETLDFVEGDTITLRAANIGRVPTLEDATVTTSPIGTKNIYLTNATPCPLQGYKSITLSLKFDATLGPIWVEQGRSVSSGPITITRAAMITLMDSKQVVVGQQYLVTGAAGGQDLGVIMDGATNAGLNPNAAFLAANVDYQKIAAGSVYEQVWYPTMAAPTINHYYGWNNFMYKSLTGATGTNPSTDTTNWQVVPRTSSAYIQEVDICNYDIRNDLFNMRADRRGNVIQQSYKNYLAIGNSSVLTFQWGNDKSYGNYVCDGLFFNQNCTGESFDNTVTGGAIYSANNYNGSTIKHNSNILTTGANVTSNYVTEFIGNVLQGQSIGTLGGANSPQSAVFGSNGDASNYIDYVYSNTLDGGNLTQITKNAAFDVYLAGNNFGKNGSISNVILKDTLGSGLRQILYNTFNDYSSVKGVFDGDIIGCTFRTYTGGDLWTAVTVNATLQDCIFGKALNTVTFSSAYTGKTCTNLYSDFDVTLDLDTGIFSAGVLTVPSTQQYAGVLKMTSAAFKTLTKILQLPSPHPVVLQSATTGGATQKLTPTAVGAAVAGNIVSDAVGTVTLVGRTNAPDQYTVQLDGTFVAKRSANIYV